MKTVGKVFSWLVSLVIFVTMLSGLVIYSSQKMVEKENLNKIKQVDVLDLKIAKYTIKKTNMVVNNSTTLKEAILMTGNLDKSIIESLANTNEFKKYTSEMVYGLVAKAKGYNESIDNTEIVNYIVENYEVTREDAEMFINSISDMFEFDGTFIKEIDKINVIFVLVLVLGLVLLCGLTSFSLYYPLLNLGVPTIIVGVVALFIKSETVLQLFASLLLLNEELIQALIFSEQTLGIILIVIGVVLIGLFILIKYLLDKKDSLDQTRRFNIEDINV